MPQVELISNLFHYYYTALSLHRCGYLGRYITGPSVKENEAWLARMGGLFERLWIERRLEGIPPASVKRLWIPDIVRRSIMRLGGSGEYATLIHNEMFARRAAKAMGECDVVHFVHSVGWEAARIAKRRGTKVICDMREEHPQFQAEILSEEAKHLGIDFKVPGSSYRNRVLEEIELADYIFCPSTYAKRTFLARGIQEEKLVVCPYGVESAQFTAKVRPPPGREFRILFLGQVCMRKGIHYLLEGFRRAELANARLILAGPVDPAFRVVLDRYPGLFEELGSVPHSQVRELYLTADVFVMPSLADSFGLVVLEAMSTGLAVIVSENTGTADLIQEGREGFVTPIRDSENIARHLSFLHQNREQCASMGENARSTARALDWDNYQSICATFYRTLFGARGSSPV